MDYDLSKRIDECLENDNGEEAAQILENSAAEITDIEKLTKLVHCALDDDPDNVSRFYAATIGRLDAELVQEMNDTIAQHHELNELCEVLRDPASQPYHKAILDHYNPEHTDDDDLGILLAKAGGALSREHKLRVARAISTDDSPDTDALIAAIFTLGELIDDDTLLKIIEKMAEKVVEE